MLARQAQIKREEIPEGWSIDAANFINKVIFIVFKFQKMLRRKPIERLGMNGHKEVKAHPWLKNFPWQKLMEKQLKAPFVPFVFFGRHNIKYRKEKTLMRKVLRKNGKTMKN